MDLPVLRVSDLACPACGHKLDAKRHKVFAKATCPGCDKPFTIPARFDNYQLNGILGTGGSGVVFDAFDNSLHRRVAIKVLNAGGDADKVAMEATNEARALARLNHPNIVPIHSLGEHKGHKYIDMGLLVGGDARKHATPAGRLDERAALDLAIAIADALRAAHRVKLVHMDVKPGNILFDETGEPKLIDFGAAQHAKMRKSKGVVGTPYYIAPEVATGKTPNAKSDIYSLGATVFHVLAGQVPFDAKDARTVIAMRLKQQAPDIRTIRDDVSTATAEVIARMLATDPDDRPADYDTLIAELRHARTVLDDPMAAVKSGFDAAKPIRQRTHKSAPVWLGPAIAVSGMIVVGVILWIVLSGGETPTDPNPTPVTLPDPPDMPDTPFTAPPDAGRLVRELWTDVPGSRIGLATNPQLVRKAPASAVYVDSLAHSVERGDDYAERFRGQLVPPMSGEYRFIVSADESAELRVSTDESDRNLRKVLTLDEKLPPAMSSEPSSPVTLERGKRYAFELYHKEAGDLDHVVLGWIMPDGTRQLPIRGDYYAPPSSGIVTVERWTNVTHDNVGEAFKTLGSRKPDTTALLTEAAESNVPGKTFTRVTGLLRVPLKGNYTFRLIANHHARLRLSKTGKPAGLEFIINSGTPRSPDEWDKASASQPIALDPDTPYLIVVECVTGAAPGHFALGIQHPDGFTDYPIPGASLEPAAPKP